MNALQDSSNREGSDREPFDFGAIVQFARDTAEQVKIKSGREIPVTSNANVRPSLVPYDFKGGRAAIEARGVSGWPTIQFYRENGVLVHVNKNGRWGVELYRQTGPIDEVDLNEAKRHFADAITEGLEFGCEESAAEISAPELNLRGMLKVPSSLLPRGAKITKL